MLGCLLQVQACTHHTCYTYRCTNTYTRDSLMLIMDMYFYMGILYSHMACVLSHLVVSNSFVTPWILAYRALLSMGFFQVRILEWVAISFSRGIHIHTDSTAFHVHVHTHKHIPTHDTQACQLYTDAFYPQTDINTEIHYTNIYIYIPCLQTQTHADPIFTNIDTQCICILYRPKHRKI